MKIARYSSQSFLTNTLYTTSIDQYFKIQIILFLRNLSENKISLLPDGVFATLKHLEVL